MLIIVTEEVLKTSICSDIIFFLNIGVRPYLVTCWPTLPVCYLGPQIKGYGSWQHNWVGNQFTKEVNFILSVLETHRF